MVDREIVIEVVLVMLLMIVVCTLGEITFDAVSYCIQPLSEPFYVHGTGI